MRLRWQIAQWFELRWWKNYLRDKNKDEYREWKRNYWKALLSKIADSTTIDSSTTICDLGCGPAGIFLALSENKITAVDPLVDEYEKLVPLFRKKDYVNTTFVLSTIEEFQPQQEFNLVFCMNTINHIDDIEKGFDKLKEICADKGTLILSIDAHNFSFFKHLFRFIPGDILHPHQYDLEGYKSFLNRRGVKVLKTELLKKEFFFNHYLIFAGL